MKLYAVNLSAGAEDVLAVDFVVALTAEAACAAVSGKSAIAMGAVVDGMLHRSTQGDICPVAAFNPKYAQD